MASAIHHGAPGSYKSFSVVQRHAIKALSEGRTVITNIRGLLSAVEIMRQFPDLPWVQDKFITLIYFDTSARSARMMYACWYRWVPVGALIIIDEAQTIYPDRADFKLESLDKYEFPDDFNYPIEDTLKTIGEARPPDVFTAFDKQRHYNWDIFLTTTNISKIKRDIRESSEWAYRHRSLSELSFFFKNQWLEHQHDPENNGKSSSHRVGKSKRYTADSRVFACYQSTATGDHIASQAGTKLVDGNGIKLRIAFIVVAIFSLAFFGYRKLSPQPDIKSLAVSAPVSVETVKVAPAQSVPRGGSSVVHTSGTVMPVTVTQTHSNDDSLSKVWRVSGMVYNHATGKQAAIISDSHNHAHLIPMSKCHKDEFSQVSCIYAGKVVESFTGLDSSPEVNKPTVSKVN